MKLSPDEEVYLRHWMHDEVHYRDGAGPAKLLQRNHGVSPADLAALIAAAMPNPQDQANAGFGPPPAEPPAWPWSNDEFQRRLADARSVLAARHRATADAREMNPQTR